MNTEIEFDMINHNLSESHGTTDGLMFGKRCLKVGKKAFVVLYHDDLVFKIGAEQLTLFIHENPNSKNWNPRGKGNGMKDWLQVPPEYSAKWDELALLSLNFTEE